MEIQGNPQDQQTVDYPRMVDELESATDDQWAATTSGQNLCRICGNGTLSKFGMS